MARELVDLKPDAIIAVTTLGAIDLKKLTTTIPIVFVVVADPIGTGLVEGLARPGGNATGLSLMAVDLSGKHLALLKEPCRTFLVLPSLLMQPFQTKNL